MDEFTSTPNDSNLQSNDSNSRGETPISSLFSSRKRKRSTNIGENLPIGQKLIIPTNQDGIPNEDNEATIAFGTKLGVVARRDIPISYKDWRDIPKSDPSLISNAVNCLAQYFEFDYQESIDTKFTRTRLNDNWRAYKHELYMQFVKDQNPAVGREVVPKGHAILIEDWREFVDYCNSYEFKAKSERNIKNRDKLTMPSCSGRTSAAVIRHKMAVERGVHDSEIGRSESYLALHTKKDKTPQNPELVAEINNYMNVLPESRATGVYDALAIATKPDGRGRFRGMGICVSKSKFTMMDPLLKKNKKLLDENFELKKAIANTDAKVDEQATQIADLRSLILRQGRMPMSDSPSPHSQTFTDDTAYIGKECNLRAGWPIRTVAVGIVQGVDPRMELNGLRIGDDNFKVYVTIVYEQDIELPHPHNDYCTTLGHLGQGSIVWPKEALQLKN